MLYYWSRSGSKFKTYTALEWSCISANRLTNPAFQNHFETFFMHSYFKAALSKRNTLKAMYAVLNHHTEKVKRNRWWDRQGLNLQNIQTAHTTHHQQQNQTTHWKMDRRP